MRVLCTGGAGYVGSACLRWLIAHGHDAIAYDNLCEGNAASVPGDRLVVGDILDRQALSKALREHGAEAVIHFAALASVPDSIAKPSEYWRANVEGTRNVLEAMREVGVRRIVASSTAATYSFAVKMPITEDSDQIPQVPYGTTKLAAEWLYREYGKAYGLGHASLRYFNASGADADGRHGEARRSESHLIPLVFQTALGQRGALKIYGGDWPTEDGTCVRDFVHVQDLAEAHRLVVEALAPGEGRAYNIGTGKGITVMQVLRACEAAAGRPIAHEIVERRPGDPGVLVADPSRLMNQLKWKPVRSDIQTIVQDAWRWHSSHPQGYGQTRAGAE